MDRPHKQPMVYQQEHIPAFLTDANGCIDSVEVTLIEPNEITNIITPIDASCFDECDGSITVNSSGGTPPYTYQLE